MIYEEAIEWLKGFRSMCDQIDGDPNGYNQIYHVCVAQADAAKTQQAYWVVKAHKEGMV